MLSKCVVAPTSAWEARADVEHGRKDKVPDSGAADVLDLSDALPMQSARKVIGPMQPSVDRPNEDLTVSVVVCAYTNERFDMTCRCVASILAGDRHPDEVILVVDSNPTLRERLREVLPPDVKVMDSDGDGVSDARTMALRIATGSIVAFIDDDAWADPSWLSELSSAFRDPDVLGAGGHVEPDWEDATGALPPEIFWVVSATYRGHRTDPGPISRPFGGNMAVRRETFLALGGFPSAFGPRGGVKTSSNEELAMFTVVTSRFGDECIQYVPTAVIHHFAPRSRCSFRYVITRSVVEGTSKAELRELFGSRVMTTDRTYVKEVIGSSVRGYLVSGVRDRDVRSLRAAGFVASSFVTTAAAYLARRARAGLTRA
jgi:glycosyltransferase involved in cell wall biosynthesis